MLEHLDREEAMMFLQESKRVLSIGGIIRLVLPDIEKLIQYYIENRDADLFLESTLMCAPRPRTLSQRLRILLVGTRHHQWMYDGRSLCKLLTKTGFTDVEILAAGQTRINNPGPLDLFERANESVYVEAIKA
jgi:predicted SAM-dependent methyltransferase